MHRKHKEMHKEILGVETLSTPFWEFQYKLTLAEHEQALKAFYSLLGVSKFDINEFIESYKAVLAEMTKVM